MMSASPTNYIAVRDIGYDVLIIQTYDFICYRLKPNFYYLVGDTDSLRSWLKAEKSISIVKFQIIYSLCIKVIK